MIALIGQNPTAAITKTFTACILASKTAEVHCRNSPRRARIPGFAFMLTQLATRASMLKITFSEESSDEEGRM